MDIAVGYPYLSLPWSNALQYPVSMEMTGQYFFADLHVFLFVFVFVFLSLYLKKKSY